MADVGLKCPYCGGHDLNPIDEPFVEAGEWDGAHYEHEGTHTLWQCHECKRGFIEFEDTEYIERKVSE